VKSRLSGRKYQVLYLLETLEHVGDKDSLYESKVRFLKEIATLIEKEGVIVVSVPKMVGISFLIQRIGLALTRSPREPISLSNLLKASLANNTTDLEKRWEGEHLGFNYRKLETRIKNEFQILKKKHILFQVLYLIRK
jgi:2-polyprenyl-3-methyl-5-hydroxy-6-metoxy-1,4-benzoquinol methylase